MIRAFDVVFIAKGVASLVSGVERLAHRIGECIVSEEIDVAADADVFYAHQLSYVIVVVENIFDRGGFFGRDEHAHAGDSHYATRGGHLLDGFVTFAARMR